MGGLGLAGRAGGRRWPRTRELPAPLHPHSQAWARGRRPGSPLAPSSLRPVYVVQGVRGVETGEGLGVTQPGSPLDGACRGLTVRPADATLWLEHLAPAPCWPEPGLRAAAWGGGPEWSVPDRGAGAWTEHGVGEEVVGGPWRSPHPKTADPADPWSRLRPRLRPQLCLFPGRCSRAWPGPLGPWCPPVTPVLFRGSPCGLWLPAPQPRPPAPH